MAKEVRTALVHRCCGVLATNLFLVCEVKKVLTYSTTSKNGGSNPPPRLMSICYIKKEIKGEYI
jgi:hypothetical protein